MSIIMRKFTDATEGHFELLLDADPSKELVAEYMARGMAFEAIDDEELVGVMVLLPTRPRTIEIMNIAVAADKRRQGIGQTLLRYALEYAQNNSYKYIEICTGTTSIGQLYLYQKMGFRFAGIERDFFLENYDEPIVENGLRLRDKVVLKQQIVPKDV
ncbi:GNAT family N-acetyltransferase [Vagococcus acidifermentans]|uniref:GNAT family N-acetyltransferase n=1 Tax=Vagococcus acidifermentans TaxID=564710 RepID=A0A430AT46_9ENTE|nr:GNAT family N-acetyltransferase [Vagococcus acidifermentans]RSU11232.1 GNAT family N-acetyltransferase [Vagococcus acidifermentans]